MGFFYCSCSWNNGQNSKDDHGLVDLAPRPSYNFTLIIGPHLTITFRVDEVLILLLNVNDPKYYFFTVSLTQDAKLVKILVDQSSVWSESEMTPCSTSFSSIASNATPNSKVIF